jgi:hypothetical protein
VSGLWRSKNELNGHCTLNFACATAVNARLCAAKKHNEEGVMSKLTAREKEIVELLTRGWDIKSHYAETVHCQMYLSQSSFQHSQKNRRKQDC